MIETIRVDVNGKTHEYPALIGEFGDYLAADGAVYGLDPFLVSAAKTIRGTDWVKSVQGWVALDGSGLAYKVEVTGRRSWKILGASPATSGELQAVYTA